MSGVIPEEGQKALDFVLPDAEGRLAGLGDFAGRWLVLYFYPKDNTSGCTVEALEFTARSGEFAALGAEVVGISPDGQASHGKFAAKHGLGVRLLSDPEHKVIEAYGAWREKNMYGRKSFGVVRSTVLIDPAGVVRRVWPKARSSGHAAQVLEELGALTGAR